MKQLIEKIKELAENQKYLKSQRKTVRLVGARTMEADAASWAHYNNRHDLRLMYAALAVSRGRALSEIEGKVRADKLSLDAYENQINKILEKYGYEEVVCVSEQ